MATPSRRLRGCGLMQVRMQSPRPVRPIPDGGTVMGIVGRAILALTPPPPSRHQAEADAAEAEDAPDAVLQVALIGEVEQLGIVDEEHDRGVGRARLRGVEDLEAPALVEERRGISR